MAQPPAGYSLQRGAYFTTDGEGPYAWDGAVMTLIGAGAAGGSGGSAGGDDVTAWGTFTGGASGDKPTTVTVNGVTWTIGYGAGNVPLTYTVALSAADDLVVTVTYTNGYQSASGNIIAGGAVKMTLVQAKTLASEVLTGLGAAANGFKARVVVGQSVNSAGTARDVEAELTWSTDHFACNFKLQNRQPAAAHTASGDSATLKTLTVPGWLFGSHGEVTLSGFASCEGDDTSRTARVLPFFNTTALYSVPTAAGVRPAQEVVKTVRALTATTQQAAPLNLADGQGSSASSTAIAPTVNTATTDLTLEWKVNQSLAAATNGLILRWVSAEVRVD